MFQQYLDILKRGGKPVAPERPREDGLAALAAGDHARAAELLQRAFEAHPSDAEVILGLATAARRAGRPDEAARVLQGVLRRKPRELPWLLALGDVQRELGDTQGAIATFRMAIAVDARCARAHRELGAMLQTTAPTEALYALNQAVYHDRHDLEARTMLAALCLGQGDAQRAVSQLHLALRLAPANAELHRMLARASRMLGDTRQEVAELQQVVRLGAGTCDDHWALGQGLQALGRSEEALAALAQAARLEATPGLVHVAWAHQAEALGFVDAALDAWRLLSGEKAWQGEAHAAIERLRQPQAPPSWREAAA